LLKLTVYLFESKKTVPPFYFNIPLKFSALDLCMTSELSGRQFVVSNPKGKDLGFLLLGPAPLQSRQLIAQYSCTVFQQNPLVFLHFSSSFLN
jgi:hypothetical protein